METTGIRARKSRGRWIALAAFLILIGVAGVVFEERPGTETTQSPSDKARPDSANVDFETWFASAQEKALRSPGAPEVVAREPAPAQPTPAEPHGARVAADAAPKLPLSAARPSPAEASAGPSVASRVSAQSEPSVYIHIRDESQRAQAEQTRAALASHGVRVSGVKVVAVGPARADLRYFRDEEAREAQRVAAALKAAGVASPQVKRVSGYEDAAKARQYELWLPPSGAAAPAG